MIVATLSLAAGAVSSGTAGSGAHGAGFSSVLAGGALLLMATFVPFAILRMIPAVESGAVGHLEGVRARGTALMTQLPRSAASHALHEGLGMIGDAGLLARTAAGQAEDAATPALSPAEGDPNSAGLFHDTVAGAAESAGAPGGTGAADCEDPGAVAPPTKGPKPVRAAPPVPSGGSDTVATARGPVRSETAVDRAARLGHRKGPATPDDAWKWEGVPPGRSLVGLVEPGKMRYYMDDDGHGPQVRWLPAAWPPEHPDHPDQANGSAPPLPRGGS